MLSQANLIKPFELQMKQNTILCNKPRHNNIGKSFTRFHERYAPGHPTLTEITL